MDIEFRLTPVKEKQHDKKTIEKTLRKTERINNFKDIEIDANFIAKKILQAAQESLGEEDLKLRVENILRINVCDPLGIPWARYEKTTVVSRSRSDALYGKVIIEYEDPDTFKTRSGFQKSIEQLKKYITEEAEGAKIAINKFFGVALDGFKIGFIRYSMRLQNWDIQKPTPVNRYSILKFLEAIRGLTRKPLDAKLMIKEFGPWSKVAKTAVKVFYKKIMNTNSQRSLMLFTDWRRVFSQVCAYSSAKIKGLENIYGIRENKIDYEALLFSVHTYYALVMKLLAAECAVLFGGFFLKSYNKKLESAYLEDEHIFKIELEELEEGGIFINLGIENFLEADYFAWYLDEWDNEVVNAVIEIVKKLLEYEPATTELEPDEIRDLFKILYQNLVPREIRRKLGEYYTPDWLAEFVLNEAGFTFDNFEIIGKKYGIEEPFNLRLLDPACGSGTFLVLAIKRIKEYAREHFLEEKTLKKILKNIIGFDLNPLAVIASRTNYLLALGELIRTATTPIELPVYFADSILVESKSTLTGVEYILNTSVGSFNVPTSVIDKGVLNKSLSLIEECVHNRSSKMEFKKRILKELSVIDDVEASVLTKLFNQVLVLENEGKNRIWTRILKNSFAPLFVERFDYVIGNPPWVNWDNLPKDYRDSSKKLYDKYKLITWTAKVGAVKTDISILFTYVCLDRYLKQDGLLGFLITQSVFKSESAEGFRNFTIPTIETSIPVKAVKVHHMVQLKPFEGAQNRTSLIVIRKGEETKYPLPYVIWKKKKRTSIKQESQLEYVIKNTTRLELVASPITNKNNSPWVTAILDAIEPLKKVVHR